jgi:hypothetical protein
MRRKFLRLGLHGEETNLLVFLRQNQKNSLSINLLATFPFRIKRYIESLNLINKSNTLQFNCDWRRKRIYLYCGPAGLRRFIGKVFRINFIEGGKVISHVGEVDGEVNQVLPLRAGRFQNKSHILKDRMTLFFDIILQNIFVAIEGHARDFLRSFLAGANPGKEKEVAHPARVRVRADRVGGLVG